MDARTTGTGTSMPSGRWLAGRYRLESVLGRGGMGVVWAAHDEVLDRPVAIKEVTPVAGLDPAERDELRRRTLHEARAAARMSSPAVVMVYDVVEQAGEPWIVMERLAPRTLADVLDERGPLPPDEVATLGLRLLDGLDAAHRAGVLHRDVKPSNVMFRGDPSAGAVLSAAVLTDFGIARFLGDPTATATGTLIGSPAFVAPERARGEKASAASDLWGLGVTLWIAAEGVSPFHREGTLQTLSAVLTEDLPHPRSTGPLAALLTGLLQKDPAQRLTAARLRPLLEQAQGSGLAPAGHSGDETVAMRTLPAAGAAAPAVAPVNAPVAAAANAPATAPAAPATAAPAGAGAGGGLAAAALAGGAALAAGAAIAANRQPAADHAEPEAAPARRLPPSRPSGVSQSPASQQRQPVEPMPPSHRPQPLEPRPTQPEQVSKPVAWPDGGPKATAGPKRGLRRPLFAALAGLAAVIAMIAFALSAGGDGEQNTAGGSDPAASRQAGAAGATGDAPASADGGSAATDPAAAPTPNDAAGVGPTSGATGGATNDGATNDAATNDGANPTDSAQDGQGADSPSDDQGDDGAEGDDDNPGTGVPAGMRRYSDQTGFSVAVPRNWTTERRGGRVYLRDPNSSAYLLIDQTRQPKGDPLRDWQTQERSVSQRLSNYKRIRIDPLELNGWRGADWEFTHGRGTHVLNRNLVTASDQAYALYWSAPDSNWARSRALFDQVSGSFVPRS